MKEGNATKFDMGEVDFLFGEKDVTMTDAHGKASKFDVSVTQGDTFILTNGDNKVSYLNSLVGNLKYTTVMGITTFGNDTLPDSFG